MANRSACATWALEVEWLYALPSCEVIRPVAGFPHLRNCSQSPNSLAHRRTRTFGKAGMPSTHLIFFRSPASRPCPTHLGLHSSCNTPRSGHNYVCASSSHLISFLEFKNAVSPARNCVSRAALCDILFIYPTETMKP